MRHLPLLLLPGPGLPYIYSWPPLRRRATRCSVALETRERRWGVHYYPPTSLRGLPVVNSRS